MAWAEKYVTHDAAGGGDGSSGSPWTLAEAIAAVAAGDRVNIKAGTYENTTTARTLATAGTTTAPIWWRGYNTTIGDIDANQTLTKPAITFTTGYFSVTGAFQIVSNLDISGAANGGQVRATVLTRFIRCRMENTYANAVGRACTPTATGIQFVDCWFKATSTATSVFLVGASLVTLVGCVVQGGGHGVETGAQNLDMVQCLVLDVGGSGVYVAGAAGGYRQSIQNCTFYSCGSSGIEFATAHTLMSLVANCLFVENGAYGLVNSSGTDTANINLLNCAFYGNVTGAVAGLGDAPNLFSVTESAQPLQSTTTGELKTTALSVGKGTPYPGTFENIALTNYLDIGAHQIQASTASGAGAWAHRMIGGGF